MAQSPINPDNQPKHIHHKTRVDSTEKKEDEAAKVSEAALIHGARVHLDELDQTAKDMGAQGAGLGAVNRDAGAGSLTFPGSDFQEMFSQLMDLLGSGGSIKEISDKLMKFLVELEKMEKDPSLDGLNTSLIETLEDELGPLMRDSKHQKALINNLISSYQETLGGPITGANLDVLKRSLNELFGPNNQLVNNAISNLRANGGEISAAVVNVGATLLDEGLGEIPDYEQEYNELIKMLEAGDFDFDKFIGLLNKLLTHEGLPDGLDQEKLDKMINKLLDYISPEILNGDKNLENALAKYFADKYPGDPDKAAEQFYNFYDALKTKIYERLQNTYSGNEYLQRREKALQALLGFKDNVENLIKDPSKIRANAEELFTKDMKDWVKAYNTIHTCGLMYSLFMVLMSGDGVAGKIGEILGNLADLLTNSKELGEKVRDVQDLITELNDLDVNDPDFDNKAKNIINNLVNAKDELKKFIESHKDELSDDLISMFDEFALGTDNAVDGIASGILGGGVKGWSDVTSAEQRKKLVKALQNSEGGDPVKSLTNYYNKVGSINTSLQTLTQKNTQQLQAKQEVLSGVVKLFNNSLTTLSKIHSQFIQNSA